MIGMTIKSGKICEHVNSLVENKSLLHSDIKELQSGLCYSNAEIEATRDIINKLYQTVDELQKNTISNSDIEELITDIRASFELFVNNTPRPDDGKMKDLEERFNVLSEKFEALNLLSDEVEIIKKTSKAIPKLNITKRKII